jgi:hypothetical protein
MIKRLRKNRAAHVFAQTPQPPSQPWYKKVWVVASAVGAAAFAIGLNGPTILQNVRKMPTEFSATSDQYLSWIKEDEKWTGDWSTFPEGIVNMADMNLSDGVDLKMSLGSKNGEIGGEISTGTICKKVPHFNFLMVRGKVSGSTARITVWHIVGGKTVTFAELDLVRKDDVITVTPFSGNSDWFPSGARLGKHPDTDKQFLINFCNRIPLQPLERKK